MECKHISFFCHYIGGVSPTAERVFQVARDAGVKPRAMRKTLADICGVSIQAVRDWDHGTTKNIKHEHLVAIARHFGVSLDYLLTGSDNANQDSEETERVVRQLQSLSPDEKAMFLRMLDAAASGEPPR